MARFLASTSRGAPVREADKKRRGPMRPSAASPRNRATRAARPTVADDQAEVSGAAHDVAEDRQTVAAMRTLAVNLADDLEWIERAVLEKLQRRPYIAAPVFDGADHGAGKRRPHAPGERRFVARHGVEQRERCAPQQGPDLVPLLEVVQVQRNGDRWNGFFKWGGRAGRFNRPSDTQLWMAGDERTAERRPAIAGEQELLTKSMRLRFRPVREDLDAIEFGDRASDRVVAPPHERESRLLPAGRLHCRVVETHRSLCRSVRGAHDEIEPDDQRREALARRVVAAIEGNARIAAFPHAFARTPAIEAVGGERMRRRVRQDSAGPGRTWSASRCF